MTPAQHLAVELHRIADDIAAGGLPLGRYVYATLTFGVVNSRADLDPWAAYLGDAVKVDETIGIPYVRHEVPIGGRNSLAVQVQAPKTPQSEAVAR